MYIYVYIYIYIIGAQTGWPDGPLPQGDARGDLLLRLGPLTAMQTKLLTKSATATIWELNGRFHFVPWYRLEFK